MAIIHGLIAHGTTIVAEYKTDKDIDDLTVVQAILDKIPPNNSKLTYVYDRYLFHYISEGGITYMCMANESFGRRIPFVFLQDIQSKILANYTKAQILDAPAYGMSSFNKVIEKQMDFYSNDKNADKLKQVQGEIDQVKDVMTHNIERVLERGERIDILVDRTDGLSQQAFAFKKRSTLLKVNWHL
ncbi:vesicle-associated membrane protein [Mucor lusitanicus]|uniref:Synaptobrevin homolog YKT6 n=1 Tax=Mucor circinelloides f. lusitanicus TaxID=29924 RepID=A0A8H4F7L1_MUCCL|nr:vesicle-associated membrane protein [Mucor lusitanicus]